MLYEIDQIRDHWQRVEQDRPPQKRKHPQPQVTSSTKKPDTPTSEESDGSSESEKQRLDLEV
ncbi:MAG TPA: hypothetical protein PLM33_10635 [Acidobacteriota bacterium]|nr:hypothetical protein [Acidobacteriota bacterium]HRV07941.1 hypothetical protein [Acidobacteriota bacterium]